MVMVYDCMTHDPPPSLLTPTHFPRLRVSLSAAHSMRDVEDLAVAVQGCSSVTLMTLPHLASTRQQELSACCGGGRGGCGGEEGRGRDRGEEGGNGISRARL